jgi:ribosome biogenesis ATPase
VADNVVEMVGSVRGEGYRDADLAALVREAGVRALRRALGTLEEMGGG